MQEIVSIKNLSKSYYDTIIFENVNLNINAGEIVVIMGENGCGKSTLLKIAAGLLVPTAGEVAYSPRLKISFVPDALPKLPFNVADYLMHMGKIQGLTTRHIDEQINKYFEILKMPMDFKKTKISNCSKGTIQKVNILQALLNKPGFIVLDEPFSGLDEASEENFLKLLQNLAADGIGMFLACHEKKLAEKIATDIYIFKDKGVKNASTIN